MIDDLPIEILIPLPIEVLVGGGVMKDPVCGPPARPPRESEGHACGTGVVCGRSEIPRAVLLVEFAEIHESGVRGLHRVPSLVHVGVDAQPHRWRRGFHELPHSGRHHGRAGVREESGLDHGEVDQLLRHSTSAKLLADHVRIEPRSGERPFELQLGRGGKPHHPMLDTLVVDRKLCVRQLTPHVCQRRGNRRRNDLVPSPSRLDLPGEPMYFGPIDQQRTEGDAQHHEFRNPHR